MRSLAGILALTAVLALPAAAGAHELRTYRVDQRLTLPGGASGEYTLACRHRDIATDGTWHVDDVESHLGRFNLVSGLDVLEADAFSRGGYRFSLRNNAGGEAKLRLTVSCLRRDVGPHRLRVGARRQVAATLAVGLTELPAVRCPDGTLAVAPGFRITGLGVGRLTASFPGERGRSSRLSLTVLEPTSATASARCLRRETTGRGGHRHALRTVFRDGRTDVSDGHVETFAVRCREGESAVLGGFRLSGSWYLGQLPSRDRISFRVQSPASGTAGDARLGVLCLRAQSSAPR